MACNGVLIYPAAKVTPTNQQPMPPPSPKIFTPQSSNLPPLLPLQLEMAAFTFFTHGYFQQANVYISEAITTD